jgi:carbon monoxide dehydrogenase subunit G
LVRIERSVEIKAPPEKIWEMLAFDRMAEWMSDWKSVAFASQVRTAEDKYRPGASAHVTEKHAKYDMEIAESLENEKIVYRSKGIGGGRVTMTLTYILKPVEAGTKVTYACDCGGWWILCPIIEGLLGERHLGVETSLNNLKSILEKMPTGTEY